MRWKLISEDKFDHSESVDKEGSDLVDGFYNLWRSTLDDTVQKVGVTRDGKVEDAPGEGFVFFQLAIEDDGKKEYIEIDVKKYLKELFGLKNKASEDVLMDIAKRHTEYFLEGEEDKIYKDLPRIS